MSSIFERYSEKRKSLQDLGQIPDWYITQGLMMYEDKYQNESDTVLRQFSRIAETLAQHYTIDVDLAADKFFSLMWRGVLGPSSPILSNCGLNRGLTVSCSGGYFKDEVRDFYFNHMENAVLSQEGFGTSSYMGDIRPRGSEISRGGFADGAVNQFDNAFGVAEDISQGSSRRGQWAGYLPVDHGDFWELSDYVLKNPVRANVGWNFSDHFIDRLKKNDPEAVKRFNRVLFIRSKFGKGYIFKPDHANRLTTQAIKNSGVSIKASNLCTEIMLPSDFRHTFTCNISSVNLNEWESFKDDDIFWSLILIDCNVSEFLSKAKFIPGLERAVRFTEKSRAVGLGTMGFHSLLQNKMLTFDSIEAHMLNNQIFSRIKEECTRASQHLAKEFGEPEWCKGTDMRNATLNAIAPNVSSALLCGGVSQGIEPIYGNAFIQSTSAGDMTRLSPKFLELAKKRNKYNDDLSNDIFYNHKGSVQHLDWLTDHEKEVLKTAFEIDQESLIRLASARQTWIDQGQSLNLFVSADEDEEYIGHLHKKILLDEKLKSAYYVRSERGVNPEKFTCKACD